MEMQRFEQDVNIPSKMDFLETYPRYRAFLEGAGHDLYSMIMTPAVFVRAMIASDLGMPAVVMAGDLVQQFWEKHGIDPKDALSKQCAGALMRTLMEANGYSKTGTKRRVPHPAFTVAEFYIRTQA